jgi:hypothetical protein
VFCVAKLLRQSKITRKKVSLTSSAQYLRINSHNRTASTVDFFALSHTQYIKYHTHSSAFHSFFHLSISSRSHALTSGQRSSNSTKTQQQQQAVKGNGTKEQAEVDVCDHLIASFISA